MSETDHRYRQAALVYLGYGVVYLAGGLYLLSQGVGVVGARAEGSRESAMLMWGLAGLVPLTVIPLLLWRPWSWLRGWASRRTFAWLVAVLLALRASKVAEVALRPETATVAAPWGGEITFRAGAIVFLLVTLTALVFVGRAAMARGAGARAPEPARR